jgi:UDP-N-acetylmuramoylalanine--D-glutamate ligase
MLNKINSFKAFLRGKRVAVLGVGISNRPLIRYIAGLGASITAFDKLPADDPVLSQTRSDFEAEGIQLNWSVGGDYLSRLKGFDLIFRTPKVRWDIPELLAERERGAVITSEMEVFMELCPARMFGVTGSDGKTTTTTLIGLFLQQAGYQVHLGGNIGTPLLDRIETIQPSDMVVLELSSFQLMSMRKSPDVAVITNITPNHLDVHKDYQEYIDAKRNIYLYQPFNGRLVLNACNYQTHSLSPEARGEVFWFSLNDPAAAPGCIYQDGQLIWHNKSHSDDQSGGSAGLAAQAASSQVIMQASDIKIPGRHNIDNYLAAITAVWPFVQPADIVAVARSFGGVEHRLELVRELDGVRYFNGSIDTSPTRTKAALLAMADRHERVVLIAGGQDKKCDYNGLGESIVAVSRKIILCGQNSPLIEQAILKEAPYKGVPTDQLQIYHCDNYADAVQTARRIAVPGEVVLLSPAGTSYDQFRHFEERGNLFKQLVGALQ